jgi:type I restriction enzyme, S subunit
MSEFPPDWQQVRVGNLLTEHSDRSSSNNQHEVLSVTKDGIFSQREYFKKQIASEDNTGYKVVKRGDVVFSAMNLWMGSIDVVKEYDSGIVSPAYITMRPRADLIDTEFLSYFLKGEEMRKKYVQHSQQGASIVRRNLNKDNLLDDEVAIPPLPEQKKIAEILSGIDRSIRAATSEKQHREKMRRSAVRQLTRGMSYQGLKKDSGTEFGMIPAQWDCQLIPDCCTIENAKRKPIKKEDRATMRGTYPYHGATRIQDYISEYAYEGEYVLIGEDGDHFSKYDEWEMAQHATGRFNVSNHAHVIGGTQICSAKWLYYSLLHRDLTFHLTRQGATRFKLSKASLECIPLLLPPPEEQQRIANTLDSMSDSISVLGNRIVKLQALKSAISSDLLSGRKRVSV